MPQLQSPRLALVVGCTNSKSIVPASDLLLRNLRQPAKAEIWARRVARSRGRRPLDLLYKGAQWRSSQDLAEGLSRLGRSVDMWVLSAGLGLRRCSWEGPSYGATFGAGPDQVAASAEARRLWWRDLIHEMQTPGVTELRQQYDEFLVVLSPTYLQVVAPDLATLDDDGVAIVTSAGIGHPRERISAGLRHSLGGADATVNQRAAHRLAELAGKRSLGSTVVSTRWQEWAAENARRLSFERERMSDSDIKTLIESWRAGGGTSAASMLRRFRDSGLACEQSRFSRLYRECVANS